MEETLAEVMRDEGRSFTSWNPLVLSLLPPLINIFSLFIGPGLIKCKRSIKPHTTVQVVIFKCIYLEKSDGDGRRILLLSLISL